MTSFYWDLRLANGRSWLGNQIIKSGNQNIDWGVSESQGNFKLFVYKHIDKCIETKSMGQRGSKGKSLLLSLIRGKSKSCMYMYSWHFFPNIFLKYSILYLHYYIKIYIFKNFYTIISDNNNISLFNLR